MTFMFENWLFSKTGRFLLKLRETERLPWKQGVSLPKMEAWQLCSLLTLGSSIISWLLILAITYFNSWSPTLTADHLPYQLGIWKVQSVPQWVWARAQLVADKGTAGSQGVKPPEALWFWEILLSWKPSDYQISKAKFIIDICQTYSLDPGGHSIVKNTGGGGWFDSLGSGILVGKDILGFFKNIDMDNS